MKPKIHPEYKKSIVTCACGNTFETRSTIGDIKIDVCSVCHPFFSGVQKFVDTDGRVEKFKKRVSKAKKNKDKENS
jgi:large subunit ribosomal protein L31